MNTRLESGVWPAEKITVVKEFTFDAAHCLPNYEGPCCQLHGHTYRLQVGVRGPVDSISGMVIDFGEMKAVVENEVVSYLDHQYLNQVTFLGFPADMPTAENMLRWMVEVLQQRLSNFLTGRDVVLVRLWETPTSYAEWRSDV